MGIYHSFYKEINTIKHYTDWKENDGSKYCGIPEINDYDCKYITRNCVGCEYEKEKDNSMASIICCECIDDYGAYLITREQAEKMQKDMDCNKTLFTDLMNKIGQDFVYMRYN